MCGKHDIGMWFANEIGLAYRVAPCKTSIVCDMFYKIHRPELVHITRVQIVASAKLANTKQNFSQMYEQNADIIIVNTAMPTATEQKSQQQKLSPHRPEYTSHSAHRCSHHPTYN